MVEGVAEALAYWYQDKLNRCQNAGEPSMSPREYISDQSGFFLDKLIDDRLDSAENAKCIIVEHIRNPWSVLKGYNPDYELV